MPVSSTASFPSQEITGVILAGGRARRMGGVDKGLVELHGKPMIEHVLRALQPQVSDVIINANRNRDRYASYGVKVIADILGDYQGPLAGIASGMHAANTTYVLTTPCDSPLISHDLAERLYSALLREDAEVSVAHDGNRMQPVFALLRRDLLPSLLEYLELGERKIDRWFDKHRLALAYFEDRHDMFINVNNADERAALEAKLAGVSA